MPASIQSPRPRRWWPLFAIVAFGVCLATGCYIAFQDDSAPQTLATLISIWLTMAWVAAWLIFFSPLSASTRRGLGLAAVVLLVVLFSTVKLEGCRGDNSPVFAWRFKARPAPPAPPRAKPDEKTPIAVDLTKTTSADWPQFLGPNDNLQVTGANLARDWTAQPPKELWRATVGLGWGSFAVVGDYAVTMEQHGEGAQIEEWVVCYQKTTGRVCWTHVDPHSFESVVGGKGPRSTPTIRNGRVYTFGALGRLNCLDGATGQPVWSKSLYDESIEEQKKLFPEWGKSCSPLVVDDLVIISRGVHPFNSLEAYDAATGDLRWSAGGAASAYDSPALATFDGTRQVVIVNAESVDAHDLLTGKLLWHYRWEGAMPKVPQPVPINAQELWVGAGYGVGCKLLKVLHVRNEWSTEQLWQSKQLKPKFTNIIVRDGFAYGLDDGKTLVCLDLGNGKAKWRSGRYGHGQVLGVDGLLLVQSEDGEIVLVDATPEKATELTRFQALHDKTWNQPVLAGRYLLVRNDQEAACYELPEEVASR
ncbi:MAG: PQQ-binding-like beta-propeller repeat protein [Planctomycetes bacterium]|nr:PQQ-binding-like beta-propeller repeat protein [Planctomycetota bacterium]